MLDDNTPVLIGGGELTSKLPFAEAPSPIDMIETAVRLAAENAEASDDLLKNIDTIAATQMAIDNMQNMQGVDFGKYNNVPRSIGNRLGAKASTEFYAHTGGNTPQKFVNTLAERIKNGESEIALLAGSENMRTLTTSLKAGKPVNWSDDPGGKPLPFGDNQASCTEHEHKYGLFAPMNTYPLFENAIRGKRKLSVEEHMKSVGKLFSGFSKVASENPNAWFPTYRSAEELITPTANNRYIGFPYTKFLNSIIEVDMSAAVLMCSVKMAKKYGIPRDRWVFLNGCADANDHYNISERVNYYSSPAIGRIAQEAFSMANLSLQEINYFDLYSCFPSAVETACDELGLEQNDPRQLTITGGLPYFGGPGNNYVTHSIKQMLDKVRSKPGSHGLCTGNGWHITKHSIGIYSTEPLFDQWQRKDPGEYQKELDALAKPKFTETPEGEATIETYTVTHQGDKPRGGIIIGRLEDNTRFIAKTPKDPDLLEQMKKEECLQRSGKVTCIDSTNIFTPTF